MRGWFMLFGVAAVQSCTSTLLQSITPDALCAILVSKIVSPISGCRTSASMPPSARLLRCRSSLACAKSFRIFSVASATSFHSLSLPTPSMSSVLFVGCGVGGSVGAGLSGAVFDHGSRASRMCSGSSFANRLVLYAGSVFAVACEALLSAPCPCSGAGCVAARHFCGRPRTSSWSASVSEAPCQNISGTRMPCEP